MMLDGTGWVVPRSRWSSPVAVLGRHPVDASGRRSGRDHRGGSRPTWGAPRHRVTAAGHGALAIAARSNLAQHLPDERGRHGGSGRRGSLSGAGMARGAARRVLVAVRSHAARRSGREPGVPSHGRAGCCRGCVALEQGGFAASAAPCGGRLPGGDPGCLLRGAGRRSCAAVVPGAPRLRWPAPRLWKLRRVRDGANSVYCPGLEISLRSGMRSGGVCCRGGRRGRTGDAVDLTRGRWVC